MRQSLSFAIGLALCCGVAASAARADWGAFYRSTTPSAPRTQAVALPDRTGMHPRANQPRLHTAAPVAAVAPQVPHPPSATTGGTTGQCITEILRAQERYNIPGNILLGIGLQEAGVSRGGRLTVWPWAVNAAGEGRLFDSRAAAMGWVRERQASGVQSIDVGCMQINLRWHPHAFASLDQGFDPAINVDYAARFLRGLFAETGDWMRAAGAYHSRTPEHAEVYLASLRRNVAVANDRIDAFRDIAGAVPNREMRPVAVRAALPQDALPAARVSAGNWDHGFWSTQDDDPGGAYGIYSRDRLQPVLPHFQQHF